MKFQVVSILDEMITFYQKPREVQTRFFDGYLKLIQTPDKKDLQRPLTFFNPMGKEHVLQKLEAMKTMGFEEIFAQICDETSDSSEPTLKTFWNLADDVAGGWTDKDQTIEKSKKIRPFITRNFCVIIFFVSEDITKELIQQRVEEYVNLYKQYQDSK